MSAGIFIVMGVSGCGKSTLACALAEKLAGDFLDADDFHPPANVEKMRAGIPLDDADRAPWLQALNAELTSRAEASRVAVLACSALKQRYRDVIQKNLPQVRWIYLKGTFELIASRLSKRAGHYMPAALLQSQFDALDPPVGDAVWVVPALLPISEQLQKIETLLSQMPNKK